VFLLRCGRLLAALRFAGNSITGGLQPAFLLPDGCQAAGAWAIETEPISVQFSDVWGVERPEVELDIV
jgi:hypothetical protein